MQFSGKHFLKLLDFTPAEIDHLLNLAAELKAEKKSRQDSRMPAGKKYSAYF